MEDVLSVYTRPYDALRLRERAEELGGRWTMKAIPGGGTCVSAELPLLHDADDGSPGKVMEHGRGDTVGKQTDEPADG